ncbi:unnamed protein product [Effrenium voratum]|uniref:Uncharacterized protein n=1 Tax=Effrenium voratum TaxID=2562239 RepID=A0AA36MS47_9DINO|nr:unnamed protein product [Effrenium voratum]CAJ1437646.1 unnamed protein product [Effrenium voratum]
MGTHHVSSQLVQFLSSRGSWQGLLGAQSRDAGQRCQSPSLTCKEGVFRKSSEPTKWPLISRVATPMPGPGRDKTKATFQLDRRHLRQSHKVKVKAARCRAEDGIVQTCLSTLDHAEPKLISTNRLGFSCIASDCKLLHLAANRL